jgi:hypothetical protein
VNQAANGVVIFGCDVLADLLESIERFVHRLQQYTQLPPTPAMDEILIKLSMELISTLARVTGKLNNRRLRECSLLLTCYFAQRHTVKRVKNFFGVKDIKEARQRLDSLTLEDVATTTAQSFGHVERLERMILGGEGTRSPWTPPSNHPLLSR